MYWNKLKSIDEKLKTLLGKHRESLVTMLSNSCHSLNPDLKESPPCDLSRKEVSERNTSTVEDSGIVVKTIELAAAESMTPPSMDSSLETLNQLVKTSTQIGSIERDLYDLLYKKFSEDSAKSPGADWGTGRDSDSSMGSGTNSNSSTGLSTPQSQGHICQNFVTE